METSAPDSYPPSLVELLEGAFKETAETPTSQKRLRLASQADKELPGIPPDELLNDPFIQLALNRLLKSLKNVFLNKVTGAAVGVQDDNDSCKISTSPSEEEKGCANQVLVEKALVELSSLTNYTWEQLNIGHWKSVPRIWRKLYTCLAILKVCFLVLKRSSDIEVIKECDMGILMGEPICQNVLSKIAEEISSRISISANPKVNCNDNTNHEVMTMTPTTSEQEKVDLVERGKVVLKNKSSNEFEVTLAKKPSLQEFLSFMNTETPALLSDTINHWPALNKWNVEYIHRVAGFRTVPVEVGQKYTSEDWTQKVMTIDEFINKYMKPSTEIKCPDDIGYVAQYHLFRQLPELGKDIRVPEYCTLGSISDNENVEINAWFGPADTISPTHYDPNHNILVQIFGSKIIRLFPPSESSKLKPHPESSLLFNTSQLDVEQDDLFVAHPEMKNAKHCDIILNAGEALYIPPKWWHYVKSLEPSFSVSFWFE
ncbi:Lysine-specific demethylase 8 [Orchesella cincta]|uniref:JmjC domain-containing protein 5 n=1 Tax=Orchesella cincta TaxID=48709 RepID=A0A1D2NDJ5_ORCCI|nr:Lysine-specific demethylase 8 [Orchesella cincta]